MSRSGGGVGVVAQPSAVASPSTASAAPGPVRAGSARLELPATALNPVAAIGRSSIPPPVALAAIFGATGA